MRLIDADELFEKGVILIPAKYYEGARIVIDAIRDAPTIEAEPKHGRWIEERSGKVLDLVRYHCSECGRWQTWSNFPYCPNCGAKMDEVDDGTE